MNRRTKMLSRLVHVLVNNCCEVVRPHDGRAFLKIPRGALVVGTSTLDPNHDRFNVGAFVRPLAVGHPGGRILDLFSGDVCDYGNEGFAQLVFTNEYWRRFVVGDDVLEALEARLVEAAGR